MIISAGVANPDDGQRADNYSQYSKVKVSAVHTRGAAIAFAVFGLVLLLADCFFHVSHLINRFPLTFDVLVS